MRNCVVESAVEPGVGGIEDLRVLKQGGVPAHDVLTVFRVAYFLVCDAVFRVGGEDDDAVNDGQYDHQIAIEMTPGSGWIGYFW